MRSPVVVRKAALPGGFEAHTGWLVEVEGLNSATFEADGRVAGVDQQQTTHRIENLEKSRYGV